MQCEQGHCVQKRDLTCSLAHQDQAPVVALLPLTSPGTHSLLALIRLTAHAKNVLVGTEEMEKP